MPPQPPLLCYTYCMTTTRTTATAPAEAPTYIARDTHAGRHSIHPRTGARRSDVYTAAELAALAPTGILWEFISGVFPGRDSFNRVRYVADAAGNLHIYDSEGARKLIHPAARAIRVLTA